MPAPARATDPAWLTVARALIGLKETVGPRSNPTILGWAKRLGTKILGIAYTDDATPWCGLFVAHCMFEAGIAPVGIAVRASAWSAWGVGLRPDQLAPGAVLVFNRAGGGHVGLYVGEDGTAYHVLGGNQGDAVSVTRIAKSRCVARRWPAGQPLVGKPVRLTAAGELSRNEA